MEGNFQKKRYVLGKGCSLSHTIGMSAEKSTLSFSHYTTDCMFYYFMKGSGNIKIEGRNYVIKEGDIILINPSELYMCEIKANILHERLVLRVNYNIVDNFLQDGSELIAPLYAREKGKGNRIPYKIVKSLGIKKYMEEILACAESSNSAENILAVCKAIEILSLCSKEIFPSDKRSESNYENPLINRVLIFLNEHFREDMSIEHIASLFNIEKSYLSHLFKECVGASLWQYVICKRLNFFNDLMYQNYSIGEAYLLTGFQNYSNFFRLYKKYMNMTPSEFKKSINAL